MPSGSKDICPGNFEIDTRSVNREVCTSKIIAGSINQFITLSLQVRFNRRTASKHVECYTVVWNVECYTVVWNVECYTVVWNVECYTVVWNVECYTVVWNVECYTVVWNVECYTVWCGTLSVTLYGVER